MILVSLLSPQQARARLDELINLLVDSVESGGAVNFVWPMTRAKAEKWWSAALGSLDGGERLLFSADLNGQMVGTVQLVPAPQENQSFRAEIAKMLVLRDARRTGVGAALLDAAEAEARRIGRNLLTLDARTGEAGERLYARMGWIKFGEVPDYAFNPDNSGRHGASFFYKKL
ncbi:MAG: GNAT family N-acetyltransferase [Rhizomicrobium sp.]